MKDVNVRIDTKLSFIVVGIVLFIFGGLLAFAYKEMSSMRRDLYAVRADYYGVGMTGMGDEFIDNVYSPVEAEILAQEVKNIRVTNFEATYDKFGNVDPENEYIQRDVREVKARVTNKEFYNVSLYDGSFGIKTEDGVIIRGFTVHPDDNQNKIIENQGYGIELAPGGTTEYYLYFPDTGEVNELIYLQ